ncbi:uncharacterized protein [Euwallacea fornicatus]|uniref:uncharacterized protein n=1 Tax=Euwallacea fornicatus TaxID=995702 RepID=UPI00338DB1B4
MLSLKRVNQPLVSYCHHNFQACSRNFSSRYRSCDMENKSEKLLLSNEKRLQAVEEFAKTNLSSSLFQKSSYAYKANLECNEIKANCLEKNYSRHVLSHKKMSNSKNLVPLNLKDFDYIANSIVQLNNGLGNGDKALGNPYINLIKTAMLAKSCVSEKGGIGLKANLNNKLLTKYQSILHNQSLHLSTLAKNKSFSQRKLLHRTLVTKHENIENPIEEIREEPFIQHENDINLLNKIDPKRSNQCQVSTEVKVEHIAELRHVFKLFPTPKNTLHNFYSILCNELKDTSLKLEPLYKSMPKNNAVPWTCIYNLKWPENVRVIALARTKKDASKMAAAKALEVLQKLGRLSPEGMPLIYQREDIKKLKKQKQTVVNLNTCTVKNLENIIQVFNNDMKDVVERVNYQEYLEDELEKDALVEGSDSVRFTEKPWFLGTDLYLAREKIVLPISKYKNDFIQLILKNNIVIVKGEPGCGKSSRIPQYVLESWLEEVSVENNNSCRIAVTQPRRIAAISLSERVANERDEQLGEVVGYQVRLKSNFQQRTGRILYCTTGILLRHLQSDPNLSKFTHVVLDEAHERDVNTDLLMNLLKRALRESDSLKLVIMSATIDAEAFSKYFDGAPILSVPGFTFPVKKHFLDDIGLDLLKTTKACAQNAPQIIHEDVVQLIKHIHKNKPEGAILVFLPGWEDLSKVQRLLNFSNDAVVYFLHSKLKDSEQYKIFSKPPPGIRKIILATNIAETSITIDDVVYVIDTGAHKDMIFDFNKGINVIDMAWISQASANQRAGRAGRCAPGEAYYLYTKDRYEKMPKYSAPKILNTSLTKVVLDSKVFTDNMQASEFMESLITPPERAAVGKAVEELKQLDLLDEHEKLTPLGRTLVNFQLEPCLAKAMVNGVIFKCATPILDIVTLFSAEAEIFGSLSLIAKDEIKKVKSQYSKNSDHLALMRIYEKWFELTEERDSYTAERFCKQSNLVPYKLEFIRKLKDVHFEYLNKGLSHSMSISDQYSDNDELVKAVLYSGTGKVLEHRNWDIVKNRLKTNVNVLVTRNNHKASISSESVNFKRQKFPSNFLVYIQETRSNVRRATIVRECSLVSAVSLMLFSRGELEIIQPRTEDNVEENLVIVGIKNTKLQFLCDRREAELLMECKKGIQKSYHYLVHQLTYVGEEIPEFLAKWDQILGSLHAILEDNSV